MITLEQVRKLMLAEPRRIECALWAALGAVVAGLARGAMGRLADSAPFITFLPFAMISATFLGWRWGAFYILCSSIVIAVFFPNASLVHQGMSIGNAVFFLVFLVSCVILIAIGDTLRRVFRDLSSAHQEIEQLSREMFHRSQNTITVVEALVRLSAKTEALTVEEYRDGLVERLHALAKANTLFSGHDQRTDLGELVRLALSPFAGEGNFVIEGPACTIQRQAGQPMALVLHELGTNALKHGALSRAGGRVTVRWALEGSGDALLDWSESGGPPVAEPSRKGMGSSLLRSMRQLKPAVDWHPEGLCCRLSVPIEQSGEG